MGGRGWGRAGLGRRERRAASWLLTWSRIQEALVGAGVGAGRLHRPQRGLEVPPFCGGIVSLGAVGRRGERTCSLHVGEDDGRRARPPFDAVDGDALASEAATVDEGGALGEELADILRRSVDDTKALKREVLFVSASRTFISYVSSC